MRQYCLCKHPKESHHSTVVNGKVVPFCAECEQCNGFGVIERPRPTHAELVATVDAPTGVAATGPRTNEEAGSVGATDPRCHCGHLESQHRARVILGRYIDACLVCDCSDFGAVEEWTVEELGLTTLLYAWDAALCQQCEWRTTADVAACLQCGAPLTPVRVEMHSREGG